MRTEPLERTNISWTPRQREVLGLLARGRTNPEIARELGISLDGAKWHVSEVMSILGVSSREAAAAYWRRENRLPARTLRMLRGIVPGPALKWAGASLAAVAAVGVFTAILLVLGSREGDTARSTPAAQGPSTLTPGVSPTAAVTSVSTPVPASGVIGEIGGEPVYELVPAAAREFPAGSVLYTAIICAVCDNNGPLFRYAQDQSGAWAREQLTPDAMPSIEGGYPVGPFVTDGDGRFAGLWCIPDPAGCGKTHDGLPDTRLRAVILSDDGGVTWRQVGTVVARSFAVKFEGGQVVVGSPAEGGATTYRLFPSGAVFDGSSIPQHETAIPLPGGGMVRVQDSQVGGLANDHSTVFNVSFGTAGGTALLAFPGGSVNVTIPVNGALLAGWAERNSKAMVNTTPPRDVGGFERSAVLVDLVAHTVSPIAGLTGNDIFQPVRFDSGPLLRVAGDGDCLNVRQEPARSATVLRCFADGVLLADTGERRSADGIEWAKVDGPAGASGWAAMQYLEGVGP